MFLLASEHNTTDNLAKRTEPVSASTSGSSCRFVGNSDRCLELHQEYHSAESGWWETVGQRLGSFNRDIAKARKGLRGKPVGLKRFKR